MLGQHSPTQQKGNIMRNLHRPICDALYVGCLGIMLSWPQNGAAGQQDLLSLVREGHRAARQSIHTFSATVTHKITFSNQMVMTISAKYWRSFDTVHIQEKQGGGTDDVLLKDGEIRQVGRPVNPRGESAGYLAARRSAVETLAQCDVWSLMRIDFAGPNGGHYDFDRFLEFAQGPPQVKRVKEGGRDCVRLTLSAVSTTGLVQHATLWHDVGHNYLVWKMAVTYENHSDRGETEILEFVEQVPGVFVPTKCRKAAYRDGQLNGHEEITLSDVEVNRPLPPGALQLPAIPAGTMLDDHISGTSYPINENWEAIGPASPLLQLTVPGKSEAERSDYHSQSTSEAKPVSSLILPASLLILVSACAYLIYRHYRVRTGLGRAN